MYINTHTHTYIYIYIHTHTHIYIHIHVYIHTCTNIYIYVYIYIYTYIYICVCTCICIHNYNISYKMEGLERLKHPMHLKRRPRKIAEDVKEQGIDSLYLHAYYMSQSPYNECAGFSTFLFISSLLLLQFQHMFREYD